MALQSFENLHSNFCMVGDRHVCPHHTNVCKIFATLKCCIFISFQQITFQLGDLTNINLSMSKVEKTLQRSVLYLNHGPKACRR